MATQDSSRGNRYQVLCFEQVAKLNKVMEDAIPIHGRGNFPTLEIKLKELVQMVREKLRTEGVKVRDIRLNGGAASFILDNANENVLSYNDVDLIFGVDLRNHSDLQKIKNCVLNCLLDFMPEGVNREKMSSCSLKEAYVQKLVKVCNEHGDKWSLISLSNNKGKNVELKFVDKVKRQYEFSVDSFQILLDSLLTFYDISDTQMNENIYPTLVAESVYGDFAEAWSHLNSKLIATRNPEEIRGGGLLKYCNLLTRGYTAANNMDISQTERYMCSRFFIDFSDVSQQRQKLEAYLNNHFSGEEELKHQYLLTLYRVVDESTICLMVHERRQALNLIHQLACQVLMEQEQKAHVKYLEMQQFDQLNGLTIDQVFYGPVELNLSGQYYYNNNYPQVYGQCPLCPSPAFLPCS